MALLATPFRITRMGTSSSPVAPAAQRPRASLPAVTLTLLHDAVAKYELSARKSQTGEASARREHDLCAVLDQLSADAHQRGLGPESVIVALKHAYVPVPRELFHGAPVATRYWAVFRLCLRSYFVNES